MVAGERKLYKTKDEVRCTSHCLEHKYLRCYKPEGHPMNWHEAPDPGGATIHTWIDPARKRSKGQHLQAIKSL